jgi:hypothetical protein
MHRPDRLPPPTLTTMASPSIAVSVTLLHRIRSADAGGRGRGSGRLMGAAKGGLISAFAWQRVNNVPRL